MNAQRTLALVCLLLLGAPLAVGERGCDCTAQALCDRCSLNQVIQAMTARNRSVSPLSL